MNRLGPQILLNTFEEQFELSPDLHESAKFQVDNVCAFRRQSG